MDKFDLEILRLVQCNNQITLSEMSETVNLSASTCRRRLVALRKSGVITDDISVLEPSALGRSVMVNTLVTLERDTVDVHVAFRKLLAQTPEVVLAFLITGEADYSLIISTKSLEDYHALVARLFTKSRDVKTFRSSIVMRRVKWAPRIPL